MTVSEVPRHWALRQLVRPRGIHQTLPARRSRADAGPPTPLLTTRLSERCCPHQRLACVGPSVRMGVTRVVTFQVGAQPLLELRRRSKVAPFQETSRQDAEPQFHLVEPRAM